MPRGLRPPPFPTTPGSWLAAYRYRGSADGGRASAEQLSHLLGVSGATIRRWESGTVRPTRDDLYRFAEVCALAPLEREFILRSFSTVQAEDPPEPETYDLLLDRALRSALPAFVLDSLLYIRAWNSHLMTISGRAAGDVAAPHAIMSLFDPRRGKRLDASKIDQFTPWIRNFWMMTSELCATPQYPRLLESLRTVGDFEKRWWEIALTQKLTDVPVNLPTIYRTPHHGIYRVFMTTVTLPPTYYLREYAPVDATAHRYVEEWLSKGMPSISHTQKRHWSEE